ncbi:AI-2E family transporter [Phormidium sp. FACHB-1136]|uniref:AI-2E family transporter n=1 Tax=Phormidium sp. FACHB-1136 TaxID=2692848 RepID=UPI001687D392|nr:AI-2E family transporter [Phormidium sp. FACHB-1136]
MKLTDWINLALLGITLYVLWRFRQIVLLMFAAVVLVTALNGLTRLFVRTYGWPRNRALLVTSALVALGGFIFLGLVFPLFASQFQELLELTPKGFAILVGWFDDFKANPPDWFPAQDIRLIPDFSELIRQVTNISTTVFGNFLSFFSSSLAILLQLLLLIVLTLMMLSNPPAYRNLLLRLFPSSYRKRADDILTQCETALISWLGGVALSSMFVGTLSFVGLVILGVPYAFAHAILAGTFNFIPNLGPTLSAIFPIFVALLQSPSKALAVLVLYIVIQNVESYWFTPMTMQKQVSLLPAATLVAQIFFTTFLGPLGLILALPLAVVCKTWIEEAWIKDVLDHDPKFDPPRFP